MILYRQERSGIMEFMTKQQVLDKYAITEKRLYIWRKEGLPTQRINPDSKAPNAKLIYPTEKVDRWIKNKLKGE